MALRFSMILEAIDRATAPAKRVQASVGKLTAASRRWAGQVRRQSRDIESGARSIEHYRRRAERLRSVALGRVFQAGAAGARRMARDVGALARRLQLAERAGKAAGRSVKWAGGKLWGGAVSAAQWGGAAATAAGGFVLFDVFKTGGEYEQYQIMLEGLEGSAAKGQQSFEWIKKFARETPFELDKVTQAFLILKNAGLDPTSGLLLASGDAAAGMSKDITQAAEAIADAATGEFERLKELGITVRSEGDQVRLQWVKNGKEMERVTSKADKVGLAMAVAAAWQDKFAGSQARQSKSLFGIISNLQDLWSGFMKMIADAGIFDKVKARLEELKGWLESAAGSKKMQEWAQTISDRLGEAFDALMKFLKNESAMTAMVDNLKSIADAAVTVSKAIGAIAEKWEYVSKLMNNPMTPTGFANVIAERFGGSPKRPTHNEPANPRDGYKPGSGWMSNPKSILGPKKDGPQSFNGRVGIDVNVKGPATATIRTVKSNNRNVPLIVNLGKTMAGAA